MDIADGANQGWILGLIAQHPMEKTGVISTQVLQEFFSAATRKLGISPLQARQHLSDFRVFDIVQVTPHIIEEGVNRSILNSLSFWHGLIEASASAAKCTELLTEDLADGQIREGISIKNPFRGIYSSP